jgi:lipopolysaccharide transport system permease protein
MEQVIRIEPRRGLLRVGWAEIWAYRELVFFLIWRDVKVRYKQTALGVAWAVLQPALTMVVFTLVFGRFAGVRSGDVPYPVFALAGLLPWQFLSSAIGRSGVSVVSNASLVSKVYFPRLVVPTAAAAAPLVDLILGFGLFAILMSCYGVAPTWRIVFLPAFVLLAFLVALGTSLWLAALNVRYRDVMHIIPFFLQLWMFASPVAYPSSVVPDRLRPVFDLNPAAAVIEGFRWCLVGERGRAPLPSSASLVVIALVLAGGLVYFRNAEDGFSDII